MKVSPYGGPGPLRMSEESMQRRIRHLESDVMLLGRIVQHLVDRDPSLLEGDADICPQFLVEGQDHA